MLLQVPHLLLSAVLPLLCFPLPLAGLAMHVAALWCSWMPPASQLVSAQLLVEKAASLSDLAKTFSFLPGQRSADERAPSNWACFPSRKVFELSLFVLFLLPVVKAELACCLRWRASLCLAGCAHLGCTKQPPGSLRRLVPQCSLRHRLPACHQARQSWEDALLPSSVQCFWQLVSAASAWLRLWAHPWRPAEPLPLLQNYLQPLEVWAS